MQAYCTSDCSKCPFATQKLRVAVISGSYGSNPEGEISFHGHCLKFFRLQSLSQLEELPKDEYDVVINEVDATDLAESLIMTSQLIDMDIRMVIAVTHYAALQETDHSLELEKLSGLFGVPVVCADVDGGTGTAELLGAVADLYEARGGLRHHTHVPYGQDVERAIGKIIEVINNRSTLTQTYHDRFLAVHLLEDSTHSLPYIEGDPNAGEIKAVALRMSEELEHSFGESASAYIHKCRHGFVNGALQETLRHGRDRSDHSIAQKVDAVLTGKWLGFPILFLILFGIFQITFTLGAYPQTWIESGVDALCSAISSAMRPGWFTSLLVDGVVSGVGAVISFLPNIIILFFFLSMLEDSGYMSRAAYLMDKLMHRVGLHGSSFIPMLIGFGCNVPAIMAARSIEDRRDRTLTMLMIPFMSCSARLPVYMLLVTAFFARYKALVMISIYVAGIVLSILFAFVMKRTSFFRKGKDDYVSELPPFRKPTFRNTGRHIWERTADYLKKISTVIIAASVVIWALEYLPAERTQAGTLPEESLLAAIGQAVAPVMAPLGFDWKMNVCLLTGLPAKEAIVSAIAMLRPDFTAASALSFMAFVLLYFPCIATLATLRKEAGRRWAAFTLVHSLVLAWIVAFFVFRLSALLV